MTDTLSQLERSHRMGLIPAKGSKPEMLVRKTVHAMGFRYRLHVSSLPGSPDLVFPKLKKIIFVHGCFWHRHSAMSCKLARLPKSHVEFWTTKLEKNRQRDRAILKKLRTLGWKVLEIWECQLSRQDSLKRRLESFLNS